METNNRNEQRIYSNHDVVTKPKDTNTFYPFVTEVAAYGSLAILLIALMDGIVSCSSKEENYHSQPSAITTVFDNRGIVGKPGQLIVETKTQASV